MTDSIANIRVDTFSEFENVLNVPLFYRIKDTLTVYYAKIQSYSNPPAFISYTYSVLYFTQVILSVLLFPVASRQPNDTISSILRLFSPILCGGGLFGINTGINIAAAFTIIDLFLFAIIFWRAYTYKKAKYASEGEMIFILTLSKYIIPLTLPTVVTGIPYLIFTFLQLKNPNVIFPALFICIVFVSTVMLQHYCFCPRVMFAKEFLHEWEASITTINTVMIALSTGSLIAGTFASKNAKIFLPIFQGILYASSSLYTFFTRAYVNPRAFRDYCTITLCLGLESIVNLVDIFIPVDPLVRVMIFVVLLFIAYILFTTVNNSVINNYINIIDACEEDISSVTSKKLSIAIKATLDLYIPSVFSFSTIIKKLNLKDKGYDDLLLVYARIISAFPSFNDQLIEVTEKVKYSNISASKSICLQLSAIAKRRTTTMTPEIVKTFKSCETTLNVIERAKYKFWDTVISDNKSAFWGCANKITETNEELKKDLTQLGAEFENTPEVISKIAKIYSTTTFDYKAIEKLLWSLDLLEQNKPAHTDIPMENFLRIFPGVIDVSPKFSEDIEVLGVADDINKEQFKEKLPIYDMIKNANIGSVSCLSVYLFVATMFVSISIFLLYIKFKSLVIDNINTTTDVYKMLGDLLFNLPRFGFSLYLKQGIEQNNSFLINDNQTMKMISRNWFGKYEDIPRINVTEYDMQLIGANIRSNLEIIEKGLSDIDNGSESISKFSYNFHNKQVPGTGKTISVSIIDLIMRRSVDDKFIENINNIYEALKLSAEEFAEETKFNVFYSNIYMYIVILVLANVFLLSAPGIFHLFFVTTQMNEISDAFCKIPSNSIRESLGKSNTNDSKAVNNYTSLLTMIDTEDYSSYIFCSMSITLFPVVILGVLFYMFGLQYVEKSNQNCKNAVYHKLGVSTTRMAFISLMQAFENVYQGKVLGSLDTEIVKTALNRLQGLIEEAKSDVILSTLRSSRQYKYWLNIEKKFRTMHPPLDENETKIPATGVDFERLASQLWTHSLDNLVFCISVTSPGSGLSRIYYSAEFYFIWWMYPNREIPFFDEIVTNFTKFVQRNEMVMACVIIFLLVIISFISMIWMFNNFKKKIDNVMLLLLQLSNNAILNSHSIMSLLNTGRFNSNNQDLFKLSNAYIKYNDYAICKVDSNYNIKEKNAAFEKFLPGIDKLDDFEINPNEDIFTQPVFIQNVKESLGGMKPHAVTKFSILLEGKVVFLEAEMIATTEDRLAYENDTEKITSCILLLRNVSDSISTESIANEKRNEINAMLSKVLPPNIVQSLSKGTDTISYSVHSITMGEIRVRASKRFSFTTKEPHIFYNNVYQVFDKIMENYPVLTKIRTIAHHYTFAGGLFMDVNKPEKHADDTIRFLLEIINAIPRISRDCGTEVSLVISVHTGGPVVAGVMSIEMPSFAVLGNVHKVINKLNTLTDTNVIHISRTVYELIFSSGFKIVESDSVGNGNEKMPTYVVFP